MLLEEELSYRIRGCVYEVFRELGGGFLEKVYEKALLRELQLQGLAAESQVSLPVSYKGCLVGQYVADMIVEDRVILELKAQYPLSSTNEAQLINYLHASGKKVGMLLNFATPKATVKRFVV